MPTYYGTYSARTNHRLRLDVSQGTQNVAGNYTNFSWALYIERTSGVGSYYLTNGGSGSVNIGGAVTGVPAHQYDTRSSTVILIASGSNNIGHNADGTLTLSVSASVSSPGTIGSASLSGAFAVTTIPRASTATFSNSAPEAGTAITINTNRASTGFTHTLQWFFGNVNGTIATNVATSQVWTVPLSLLDQIPNATQGNGHIRVITYSGATLIGQKDTAITIKAGAAIVPSFTTVTHAEATAGVAAAIGGYVQSVSTLALAITGATVAYSSPIASYKITVAGQTINAVSGTTPAAIAEAGSAVAITATITDGRGRTATKTVNIVVLAYAPPVINAGAFSVQRALSNGVVNEEGTYLRTNLNVAVSSLIVSTVQKNTLTYKVFVRVRGATSWGTAVVSTLASGITFASYALPGPYSIESSWEVLVQIVDKFATSSITATVATANIFMHWGPNGIGLGKFHEFGAVDVAGAIFQNNGKQVLDQTDVATPAEFLSGTGAAKSISVTDFNSRPIGLTRRTTTALSTGNATYANMSADAAWGSRELLGGMTYSNGFIIPTGGAGMYVVEWSLLIAGTPAPGIAGIAVNAGGSIAGDSLHAAGTFQNGGAYFGNGSAMVRLNAADVLTLWGYGSGAALSINALANRGPHWGLRWIAP